MNVRSSRSHAIFRMVYNSGSFHDSVFAAALPFYIITYSNEGGRKIPYPWGRKNCDTTHYSKAIKLLCLFISSMNPLLP
jgi:hypothetical protein